MNMALFSRYVWQICINCWLKYNTHYFSLSNRSIVYNGTKLTSPFSFPLCFPTQEGGGDWGTTGRLGFPLLRLSGTWQHRIRRIEHSSRHVTQGSSRVQRGLIPLLNLSAVLSHSYCVVLLWRSEPPVTFYQRLSCVDVSTLIHIYIPFQCINLVLWESYKWSQRWWKNANWEKKGWWYAVLPKCRLYEIIPYPK